METKDGALVFLALLSIALFTTLAYSVWHNGNEIVQLQAELQKVKESVRQKLPAVEEMKLMPTHNHLRRSTEQAGGSDVHKLEAAQSELEHNKRSAKPAAAVQLLTNALSEIVGGQLEAFLDCDTDDNNTKCTIEPGPKGERGPIGQRGDKGDIGEQGSSGHRRTRF